MADEDVTDLRAGLGAWDRPIKIVSVALVVAIAVGVLLQTYYVLVDEDEGGSDLATVTFQLADGGSLDISCEVADDTFERAEGLQHRKELANDSGMLFVYESPREASYIMINTLIPLDIIFIAENGTVVNVEEAEVEDPDTPREDLVRYRSDGDVLWVVEINQGLSQQYGIGPGTTVKFEFPPEKTVQ